MGLKSALEVVRDTFVAWRRDRGSQRAAALAFYTILSLAPLLIIAVGIAGLVFGTQQARETLVNQIEQYTGEPAAGTIREIVGHVSLRQGSVGATVIGIAMLLVGAMGVFHHLQDMLNTIWGERPRHRLGIVRIIVSRLLSFMMVLFVGLMLLALLMVGAFLAALGKYFGGAAPRLNLVWQGIDVLVSLGLITLLLAMVFKLLPNAPIPWKDVWTGAILTALLFTAGKFLLGLYLGRKTIGSPFGAAASLFVLLLWIYYSAQILFIGAEFTRVLTQRQNTSQSQPPPPNRRT
ncbi:MAG: YihY/virulence factor BrkB family protein [bacterium]|nr:YihY/virulence factor BrkB family protein [bacterium]